MPVTQQNGSYQYPYSLQVYYGSYILAASRGARTADAAETAIKANNTELATELKAKLKGLFENAPEEAKTRGLIGFRSNTPVPQRGAVPAYIHII
jgi:hypothetical protein